MAQFLYKLGLAAYDHRKKFIAGWISLLALIGILAAMFMGTLSNTFSLPGTETQRVLQLMGKELPELSGGNGTIVFQTKDGKPFTDEQKQAVETALKDLGDQEPVRSVLDPFNMQNQLDSGASEIADGKAEITANETKLGDGEQQISDGAQQLLDAEQDLAAGEKEIAANEKKLTEGRTQLEAGKAELATAEAKLATAKKQLDAGAEELASGKSQLAAGEKEYAAGKKQLDSGQAQLAAGKAELAAGQKEYAAGKKQYDAGVKELTANFGVSSLDQVPAAIKSARAQVNAGLDQAKAAKTELEATIADLEAKKAYLESLGDTSSADYQKVIAGLEQANEGLTTVNATITQLNTSNKDLDTAQAGYEKLSKTGPQLTAAKKKLDAAEKTIATESAKLEAGKKELAAAASQLAAARTQIAAGQKEYDSGLAQYNSGLAQVNEGKAEIATNEATLEAGEKALAEGKAKLEDGRKQIEENKQKIADSRKEIADGKQQLADGKEQLATAERTLALSSKMQFINDDDNTAISQVVFYGMSEALTSDERSNIESISEGPAAVGVETLFSKEIMSDLNSIFGATEMIGMVIAAVVLFIMLGTFVAAGLPLLMALFGVGLGVGGTMALSSLIDMQSITPALALMLGLAVGIDYSLFIVHRHRTQLLSGMNMRESIGRSIGTSGNAVVFAGLTVIIALSALVVTGLPFMSALGLSAAFTVLMSVLLSVTFTPALLGVIGEKLLNKKGRAKREAAIAASADGAAASVAVAAGDRKSPSLWWAKTLTKKPWLSAIASVVVLGVIALPATKMLTALPDGGSEAEGSQAQRAYVITSEEFGPGYNGQLIVMAKLPDGVTEAQANEKLLDVAEQMVTADGVHSAIPAMTNKDLTYGAIQVIPTSGPADPETEAVVHELRGMADSINESTGVETSVTGQVAAQIDVSEKINAALPPYLIIVVGLSLVLLLLVFRSVVVPVIATLGFLLSLAASFGATVAVYQWGWFGSIFGVHNPAPIMSFLPILLTGILFGLAMDYQVFLVTAIREAYAHGSDPRKAVKEGFNHAAPVVVAAALIMVSVFASFIFAHLAMIRPIGFALAFGVLFDAFIVRMTLTPAVMHLLGEKAWYLPKWLGKILPDVDVEGAKLQTHDESAARSQASEPAGV